MQGDKYIDSRDLIEYLEENPDDAKAQDFAEEFENYSPDYHYGVTAIHIDEFPNYVRELVQEVGYVPRNLPAFIENAIDWEHVTDEIAEDYTLIEYGEEWYYVR